MPKQATTLLITVESWALSSVADPGCLSPDPDFYPSRIPDLTTAKKGRGKKLVVLLFFVATNKKNKKNKPNH